MYIAGDVHTHAHAHVHTHMDDTYEIWEESASRLQERSHLKTLLHDAHTTDACIY